MQGPLGEWSYRGRILLFQFHNAERLTLELQIGPGPEATRAQLFELAKEGPLLRPTSTTLNRKWTMVYQEVVLSKAEVEEGELLALQERITDRWTIFVNDILPLIRQVVREAV